MNPSDHGIRFEKITKAFDGRCVLDEVSFEGSDLEMKEITIDANYVRRMLSDVVKNQDLSRYIL